MIQTTLLTLPLLVAAQTTRGMDNTLAQPTAGERAIVRTLQVLRNKERPSNDELVVQMLPASRDNLAFLFEMLRKQVVPGIDGGEFQVLSIYQEDVILETVARMKRHKVRHFLRQKESALEFDDDSRRAAIEFIGAVGTSADFSEVLRLSCSGEDVELIADLGPSVRRAVGSILRNSEGYRDLLSANGHLPEGFIREIVLAIGDVGDPRGLEFLAEVLDWHAELATVTLAQVRKVGPCQDEEINEEARTKTRGYLDLDRPMLARTASLACAALEDMRSLPLLIGHLEAEDQGIRANAYWALQHLTRQRLSPRPEDWSRWYAEEKHWVKTRKLPLFGMLGSSNPGVITKAMAEISRHPTVREDFNEALLDLLDTRFPQVRLLAIRQLAELGFESSRHYLEVACHDPVDEVAEAARQALDSLPSGGGAK